MKKLIFLFLSIIVALACKKNDDSEYYNCICTLKACHSDTLIHVIDLYLDSNIYSESTLSKFTVKAENLRNSDVLISDLNFSYDDFRENYYGYISNHNTFQKAIDFREYEFTISNSEINKTYIISDIQYEVNHTTIKCNTCIDPIEDRPCPDDYEDVARKKDLSISLNGKKQDSLIVLIN